MAPKLAEWLKKLDAYFDGRKSEHERTKVAILDNGILGISPMAPDIVGNEATGKGSIPEEQQSSQTSSSNREHGIAPDNTGGKGALNGAATGSKHGSQETPNRRSDNKDDNTLWTRIKAGRSFVESNTTFWPWQFPSDPHGTQMANLICAIDPFCEIYVARVAEDATGITPKAVAKVIKTIQSVKLFACYWHFYSTAPCTRSHFLDPVIISWSIVLMMLTRNQAIERAISQDVDIISMSFVLGGDSDTELASQITSANEAGIVMTCSTHDEGSRITKAWPASYKTESLDSLIVLAGCDEYGKLLRDIDTNKYDYRICSQNVPAGIVPFVKSAET